MQLRYTVHSCVEELIDIVAEFNGQSIPASVVGLVVELVADDERASITLRYVPKDIVADKAMFQPGAAVSLTAQPEQV